MQKVVPLEFVDKESLDYNLYDKIDRIIYKKNTPITPEIMLMLLCQEVYREPIKLPDGNMEELVEDDEPKVIIEKAPEIIPQPPKVFMEAVIAADVANALVGNLKEVLDNFENEDDSPNLAVCEATRELIVDQVKQNITKIKSMEQLRIIDEYTYSHAINVSLMSTALAIKLRFSERDIQDLALGALLHDIGKVKTHRKKQNNKGGLMSDKERKEMYKYTIYGYDIIKGLDLPERIAKVALQHQERFDGSGYMKGLKRDEISLFARITTIADNYDSLVTQKASLQSANLKQEEAIKIMISDSGKIYDPNLLYKFVWL